MAAPWSTLGAAQPQGLAGPLSSSAQVAPERTGQGTDPVVLSAFL